MKETPNSANSHSIEGGTAEMELRERIEKRAYHLWLSAGGGHGDHLHHWLQAEGEILNSMKQEQQGRDVSRKTKPSGKPRSAGISNDALITK